VRRFAAMFQELDATTRTNDKVAALARYLREVEPSDAAWATAILSGRKVTRAVSSTLLRELAAETAGLPVWLVHRCHVACGDLSETLALLLPDPAESTTLSLTGVVERYVRPLGQLDRAGQAALVVEAWSRLDRTQRFLFHKLISTSFRVGVSRRLVVRAAAEASGVDSAVIDHRLTGRWKPSAEAWRALVDPEARAAEPGQPYPFCLAYPLEQPLSALGGIDDWQLEWKWDGIRAQVLRRAGGVLIGSRGDESIESAFPELAAAASSLPDGTVLDGEVLAWDEADDRPAPFARLQRRLNRKRVELSLWPDVPVRFFAYDLLERGGEDVRERPLAERRAMLEAVVAEADEKAIGLSRPVEASTWEEAAALRATARERRVEGLMLKRLDSVYRAGRVRGVWWKLKVDPLTLDVVMTAAEPGHGRRAGLYTDYTFSVWEGEELTPVARAYSGLTDDEIAEVDRWVRRHTVGRFGPVRTVEPALVFELGFEGLSRSDRHRSGLALRFPRMLRRRWDKKPEEADRIEDVRAMLEAYAGSAA